MGKRTSGGGGMVIAISALAQRLGNYENKALAVVLLIAASALFAWLVILPRRGNLWVI